jgi:hypothetical protein
MTHRGPRLVAQNQSVAHVAIAHHPRHRRDDVIAVDEPPGVRHMSASKRERIRRGGGPG